MTTTPQQVIPASASASTGSFATAWPATDQLLTWQPPARQAPVTNASPPAPTVIPVALVQKPSPSHPTAGTPRSVPATIRRTVAGGANGFAYGYCTWWVAHRRSVPWRGNAAQWWWNARAFGYAEGWTPRVGSIMVMGAGGSASTVGHVAYVERVNANGTFVVSEMNWWGVPGGGWGRVDYRTVTSMRGILGFIY